MESHSDQQKSTEVAPQEPPETDKTVAILVWILANPISSLTILAAVSYLAFRVAFLIYYSRFGVTPEEVGLNYAGILTAQAAGGLLEVLPAVGIALYMRMKIASNKATLEEAGRRLKQTSSEEDAETVSEYIKYSIAMTRRQSRTATLFIIGVPLSFLILVVSDAARAGVGARTPSVTSPFQARATPVAALWVDPPGGNSNPRLITYSDLGTAAYATEEPGLLLLGSSEGVVVLYEKRLGAVRLPKDKVMLVPR